MTPRETELEAQVIVLQAALGAALEFPSDPDKRLRLFNDTWAPHVERLKRSGRRDVAEQLGQQAEAFAVHVQMGKMP